MRRSYHNRLALSIVTMLFHGLVSSGWGVSDAQAQLSKCSESLPGLTRCESPRAGGSVLDTLKRFQGSGINQGQREGLGDLGIQPQPSLLRDPLDPVVAPSMPPIGGARDYLNRRDPAHAIQPLQPPAPNALFQPGVQNR